MRTNHFLSILIILLIISGLFWAKEVRAGLSDNVAGWAWSENIGWISFNSINTGGPIDYGVKVDLTTGVFSGYAWSRGTTADVGGIGWIQLNPLGPYPAAPNWSTCLDLPGPGQACDGTGDYTVSGWVRAYRAIDPEGQTLGGWTGWIKMRGTAPNYGVLLDIIPPQDEFRGWAWGGGGTDTTTEEKERRAVIGWISFNCVDGGYDEATGTSYSVCGTSDYKVFIVNQPPSATNLTVTQANYCGYTSPPVFLKWTFTDPGDSQSAYQVQVDNSGPGFPSPEVDVCVYDSTKISNPIPGFCTSGSGGSTSYSPPNLSFGTTYDWRVKVWDSSGLPSPFAGGPSFSTLSRPPWVDFNWSPPSPSVDEVTQFCSVFQTGVCETPPATGWTTCYSLPCTWSWTFQDGNPATSTIQNPQTKFTTNVPPSKTVTLRVTDSLGYYCDKIRNDVGVSLPLPEWREIAPTSWLLLPKFVFENLGKLLVSIFQLLKSVV